MFSRFFNKKSDSSPDDSDPIPSAAAPATSLPNDTDFEHIAQEAAPSIPGLYPQFNRLGIQTQQSIDKGPHQNLTGVPFKLSAIVLSKNNASVDAQQFQVREILCRMKNNLDRPSQLVYEFNAERNVLQTI